MRVLWVLNSPIGTAAKILGYSFAASGTWIAAAEKRLKEDVPDLIVDYAVMGYCDRVVEDETLNCKVYEINIKQCRGKKTSRKDYKKWTHVISQDQPDIIHIWGTEFSNFVDVIEASGNIPVAVTIQGVVTSLAKYCDSDVPYSELMKGHGLSAFPAYLRSKQKMREMKRQSIYEKKIVSQADAILYDNEWTAAYCNTIAPGKAQVYFPLAINEAFSSIAWNYDTCEKDTLFTIAPSSSMKGAHILLKALSVVKKLRPNVKLYIPGSIPSGNGFMTKIKVPPYFRYLKKLVNRLGLGQNVEFCGKLSSQEMAEHLAKANVFVMPSKAENISTSLREAMHVGCPCITSLVGAVPELAVHGYNALCYRYEEYEILAFEILKLLGDPELSKRISGNGNKTICEKYPIDQTLSECADWYRNISRSKNI